MDFMQELDNEPPKMQPSRSNQYVPPVLSEPTPPTPEISHIEQPMYGASLTKEQQKIVEKETGCTRFFKLRYYQKYFAMSEHQVIERMKAALIPPYNHNFMKLIRPVPDFYGPFWILTTLIFVLGTAGNFSNYILSKTFDQLEKPYFFKLQLVRYAVVLIYSFGLCVPGLLFLVMRFLGDKKISLAEFVCIYGYSCSCSILVCIFCILPLGFLEWIFILYGLVNSSLFLIFTIKNQMQAAKVKQGLVFGLIIAAQFALMITFKLLFFNLIHEKETVPVVPVDPK